MTLPANATLAIDPDLLGVVIALLPQSARIVGSEESDGSVKLKLSIRTYSDEQLGAVQLTIHEKVDSRTIEIRKADGKALWP